MDIDASGPRFLPRILSGSVVLQQLGSMMISMTCVTTKGHTDAQTLGHHMCPCWGPKDVHAGTVKIWMACTATNDHGVYLA